MQQLESLSEMASHSNRMLRKMIDNIQKDWTEDEKLQINDPKEYARQQNLKSQQKQIEKMELSDSAVNVLQKCTVEGNNVKLPGEQLERSVYLEVAKSLELIGGKWKGGKIGAFIFQVDPTDLLNQIANGEKRNLKKEFQFFATPQPLAEHLVYLADLQQHDTVLEPSAGQGAIISEINKVCDVLPDCYELMDINIEILKKTDLRYNLLGPDFLSNTGKQYTKIIANPPFSKNQDIDHIKEMYNVLARGGRLVTVSSESWTFGSQKKQVDFRNWLDEVNADVSDIERESFKQSGTMVGGRIIVINKPL